MIVHYLPKENAFIVEGRIVTKESNWPLWLAIFLALSEKLWK